MGKCIWCGRETELVDDMLCADCDALTITDDEIVSATDNAFFNEDTFADDDLWDNEDDPEDEYYSPE